MKEPLEVVGLINRRIPIVKNTMSQTIISVLIVMLGIWQSVADVMPKIPYVRLLINQLACALAVGRVILLFREIVSSKWLLHLPLK